MLMDNENMFCVIGPPGCGKTTSIEKSVARNAEIYGRDRIVVSSLTRAAAIEAAGRVGLDPQNVGTLHAMAYRSLGAPQIAEKLLKSWNEEHPAFQIGATVSFEDQTYDTASAGGVGDGLLSEYTLLRSLKRDRISWPARVTAFAKLWEGFKASTGAFDFTDLIEVASKDTLHCPNNPDVIFIDEAQDSSTLEGDLIARWTAQIQKCVIVGDPNQSLFEWRGASPETYFPRSMNPGRLHRLKQSFRVPKAVLQRALTWISKMPGYHSEAYNPTDAPGKVTDHYAEFGDVALSAIRTCMAEQKTCMVLASCGYMLNPLIKVLREEGIPFQNQYRRTNGAWNPLHGGGVTGRARLLSWLAPREDLWAWDARVWDIHDLKNWSGALKGVFRKGGKKLIAETESSSDIVSVIQSAFTDEALAAIAAQDFDWFKSNFSKQGAASLDFPLHILGKNDPDVLKEEPLVSIGTIHSVKGGEADHVVISQELSQSGWREFNANAASVYRLYYVAMTRAREELHITHDGAKRMSVEI